MDVNTVLQQFGSVTLSLSNLILIQIVIAFTGMCIAGLAFLCIYEPKINGPLQQLIPIGHISSLKKKIKPKNKNDQLRVRQQRAKQRQEKKHLMEATTTDTEYHTVNQESEDDDDDDDDQVDVGGDNDQNSQDSDHESLLIVD
mmetsp:Transcript_44145/g.72969  ORF Transcript_44145/g.72969 Transcript_44145/m.72969 type:complete len:143 (-) Transcript_44145:123-551(-)